MLCDCGNAELTQWHDLASSESNSFAKGTACSSTKTWLRTSIASMKTLGIDLGCS